MPAYKTSQKINTWKSNQLIFTVTGNKWVCRSCEDFNYDVLRGELSLDKRMDLFPWLAARHFIITIMIHQYPVLLADIMTTKLASISSAPIYYIINFRTNSLIRQYKAYGCQITYWMNTMTYFHDQISFRFIAWNSF